MSPEEIDFLARLGPLLPTPRAAKKLVNLYRLVRIGIPDADLPAFLAEHTHKSVQLLLALLVGMPNDARVILTAILAAEPADNLIKFLRADTAPDVPHEDWTATEQTRQQLVDLLEHLRVDAPATCPTVETCQRWCPKIARYSFHTRTLAKPHHPNGYL
jgi:hypothetical protein